MGILNKQTKFYFLSFLKHDFKASITVFFVALPLCLGISLASGAPLYSGLIAGIIGGLVVGLISGSELSVSGPAAGLTAICASAISGLGGIEALFLAVAAAGFFQILLGIFKLGGFTHFIPSTVIKGMLAGIGIILMSKQIPLLFGYDQADFWTKELFNVFTLNNGFEHISNIYFHTSRGATFIALTSLAFLVLRNKFLPENKTFVPTTFFIVLYGVVMAILFNRFIPSLALKPSQFVAIPQDVFSQFRLPDFGLILSNFTIIQTGAVICFVATLETLLSIEAVDKLDRYNRITPHNRELIAQGTGNILSGVLGGLPVTAVIVRSSANAEAGAKTKLSGFFHGVWLLLMILAAVSFLNKIPYCVLAVILVRTGFNLAKPKMIRAVYKLGREQFIPFIVTAAAILFTDLLIGVCIGIAYAGYFILKNTYKAGYTLETKNEEHQKRFVFHLAINVSFINKKKLKEQLEKIPDYSVVEIDGSRSVYIDYDIVETISEFKAKAHHKHIELNLKGIREVDTLKTH